MDIELYSLNTVYVLYASMKMSSHQGIINSVYQLPGYTLLYAIMLQYIIHTV